MGPKRAAELQVSAAEFILEGLHAHKRIGRSEERVFTAGEKQPKGESTSRSSQKNHVSRGEGRYN